MKQAPDLRVHGAMAFAIGALHNGYHLARGEGHDLFWMCNVAPWLLSVGCFVRSRALAAISLLWLCFGTPMWLLDLATGGTMIATSWLTHVVAPVVAVLAARRLGWPSRGWLVASGVLLALLGLTRLLSPPKYNVNLVFSVWPGWESMFPSFAVYFGLLFVGSAATFFVLDRVFGRWWGYRDRAS